MDTCIAVASQTFGSKFQGLVYAQLRRNVGPGQRILECATVRRDDLAFQRARMLELLRAEPRPTALITLCVRPEPETIDAFRRAGIPIVLVDDAAEGATTVASDNEAGGYLAGRHLAGAGRRAPGIVTGLVRTGNDYNAVQRLRGFRRALDEQGVPLAEEDVFEVVDYSRKDGIQVMTRLLRDRRRLDALFCAAGDACATGLLAAAREREVPVPERLAILGYDDSPLASISEPPLSTVSQPLQRMAAEAHRLATEATDEILTRPKKVLFEPTLVLRQTA